MNVSLDLEVSRREGSMSRFSSLQMTPYAFTRLVLHFAAVPSMVRAIGFRDLSAVRCLHFALSFLD